RCPARSCRCRRRGRPSSCGSGGGAGGDVHRSYEIDRLDRLSATLRSPGVRDRKEAVYSEMPVSANNFCGRRSLRVRLTKGGRIGEALLFQPWPFGDNPAPLVPPIFSRTRSLPHFRSATQLRYCTRADTACCV